MNAELPPGSPGNSQAIHRMASVSGLKRRIAHIDLFFEQGNCRLMLLIKKPIFGASFIGPHIQPCHRQEKSAGCFRDRLLIFFLAVPSI